MEEFFNTTWFTIREEAFTYGEILFSFLFVLVCLSLYWLFYVRYLPKYFEKVEETGEQKRRVRTIVTTIFYLSVITGLLLILDLNSRIFENQYLTVRISAILEALLIIQIARLADWLISHLVVNRYYSKRDEPKPAPTKDQPVTTDTANRTVQFAVYLFATILILTNFEIDYTIFEFEPPPEDGVNTGFQLRISNILAAVLTLFVARLIAWVSTEIILYSYYKRIRVDTGSQYAFNQILKYVIYLVAILVALNQLGINTTLVLGGLAALLVGIGLGLQQTFNDFFSGLILLFERSVEVNHVLNINGMIGRVTKIGIRASQVETRDNLTVVVPNSALVSQNVINWSHEDAKVRFWITVPVPYGTKASVVKEILLAIAKASPYVLDYPAPFIRLVDFADSSLNFELHFWSSSFMIIEDVKSDLRLQANDKLLEADIKIPFPQRDIWIKSEPES